MRTTTHSELRNQSGRVLRDAEAGETTIITSHGRPVAAVGPVTDATAGPRLSRPASKRGFSGIRRHKVAAPSQQILDELRSERL